MDILTKNNQIINDVTVVHNISLGSDNRLVRIKVIFPRKPDRRKYLRTQQAIDKELLEEQRDVYEAKVVRFLKIAQN